MEQKENWTIKYFMFNQKAFALSYHIEPTLTTDKKIDCDT